MTPDEVLVDLTEILRDVFDLPDLVVTRETTAHDIKEWDSVAHINVIVGAERRFGVKFKTAELDEMKDVGELVDLIARKKNR